MSFAFLPFYTGDYLRDTRHLSMMEHGAYVMFLTYCWDQTGPIPLDERKQIGIVNARSKEEIEAMRAVLREFFVLMDDGWYNRRMQRELERAAAISNKRKAAGSKGYQAKAKHLPGKSLASATTPTTTTTSTITPKERTLALSDESLAAVGSANGLFIPLAGKREWQVPAAFISELDLAYPGVDGPATLREIRAWCVANPTRCKTERGVKAFVNRWFSKDQNRG